MPQLATKEINWLYENMLFSSDDGQIYDPSFQRPCISTFACRHWIPKTQLKGTRAFDARSRGQGSSTVLERLPGVQCWKQEGGPL